MKVHRPCLRKEGGCLQTSSRTPPSHVQKIGRPAVAVGFVHRKVHSVPCVRVFVCVCRVVSSCCTLFLPVYFPPFPVVCTRECKIACVLPSREAKGKDSECGGISVCVCVCFRWVVLSAHSCCVAVRKPAYVLSRSVCLFFFYLPRPPTLSTCKFVHPCVRADVCVWVLVSSAEIQEDPEIFH